MKETKHLLISGEIGVGKSTLIQKLLSQSTRPIAGFRTKKLAANEEGGSPIHIYPAGEKELVNRPENMVGLCTARSYHVFKAVFNSLGVQYLDALPGSIIVMDELGFMEAQVDAFTQKVLNALDGDIPIIAAIKERQDVLFLNQVRRHPKAALYRITQQNRDALYQELLPVIQSWNTGAPH